MRAGAAGLVALVAFLLYHATLLPDFDLGDSASFQTMGGAAAITPRDGYPLYYAIARPVVPLFDNHAYAMNLLSAVEAAAAAGMIVLVGAELSGSLVAGIAAALLFAGSYTFWSQAVVAEVYALHVLLVASTLLLLLRWQLNPTSARLFVFMTVYALSFGNHLSMILVLPGYAIFLLATAPGGWRSLFTWRVVAIALGAVAIGAAQYLWNFRALWWEQPAPGLTEALRTFWFDVTKSDWRETMVLEVPSSMVNERLRLYLFDLVQQFGWAPLALAATGLAGVARGSVPRAVLLALMFAATLAFALGYNVGDVHVFFLPSHLIVALLCAPGIVVLERAAPRVVRRVLAPAVVALAASMIYWNYPALDRSDDRRPVLLLQSLTAGILERNALLLSDLHWQVQNGLTYFGQHVHPQLLHARLSDVVLYAPALIRENQAIGRDVVLTEWAAQEVAAAYGPALPIAPDQNATTRPLSAAVNELRPGTLYVLCVLEPTREYTIDDEDLSRALRRLTGDAIDIGDGEYVVIAGRAGEAPALVRRAFRPFRERVTLDGVAVDIRMESWLRYDTIRRMGFGHVIANRRHALIVERGVSFVALDGHGQATQTAYAAGIYADQPRSVVLSSN